MKISWPSYFSNSKYTFLFRYLETDIPLFTVQVQNSLWPPLIHFPENFEDNLMPKPETKGNTVISQQVSHFILKSFSRCFLFHFRFQFQKLLSLSLSFWIILFLDKIAKGQIFLIHFSLFLSLQTKKHRKRFQISQSRIA